MCKIKTKILGLALVVTAVLGVMLPQAEVFADKDININVSDYGYGEYLVTARGVGYGGVYDEDYAIFYYYPAYAEATKNDNISGFDVELTYNAYDEASNTGEVAKLVINVYDSNGNLIKGLSPVTVFPPTTTVQLPFGDYGLESGTYTIAVSAYNNLGEELYKPYEIQVYYEAPSIPVPDTGSFMGNLNISKTDYLVTGLIVFGLVGIGGFAFIAKRGKKTNSRRRR